MNRSDGDRTLTVHAVLTLVAVLFSFNYILGKIAMREFTPLSFAYVRVVGSALLLLVVQHSVRTQQPHPSKKDLPLVILCSLLGVVINQVLFMSGLNLTSAHTAAMLITSIPVFTLAAAMAMHHERGTIWKFSGIAIAGTGALLIIGFEGIAGSREAMLGDVMILLNCASYGAYLVISRPLVRRVSTRAMMTLLFGFGSVLMLPFSLVALLRENWAGISGTAWGALAAVIAGPTVGAYLLNAWALRTAKSSTVAAYTYLQPFIASLLAFALLGETLHLSTIAAGLLICAGVYLTTRDG